MSVLCADVAGSMDISEGLDAEQWWLIMDRFCALLADGVHRLEGIVEHFTGDGMTAVFGAPLAHEDHARRAAHAALYLRGALASYAEEVAAAHDLEFSVRMGINSGEVIVGTIGDHLEVDYAAIGRTAGVAERMERLAEPGRIYVSEATAALIDAHFELADLGEFAIKGSRHPHRVFELVRERGPAAGRLGQDAEASSPFVGREREREALAAFLRRSLAGEGRVVRLVGEPGVGKSRLAQEFAAGCEAEGIEVLRARAFALGRDAPLLLVLELWRAMFGVGEQEAPAQARDRVAAQLALSGESALDDAALVYELLGIADPASPAAKIDPEARQRRLLALLRLLLRNRGEEHATVMLIEDLQWIDAASEIFLAELVDAVDGMRALLVLTQRPDYEAPALARAHCERLEVGPLPRAAAGELLQGLLGGDRSLDGLSELIVARAAGNPYFCEELVAAVVQSGHLAGEPRAYRLAQTVGEIVLPGTVQATIAARIDRLSEREKELVQIAAVLGHQFSGALVSAISDAPEDELAHALDELVAAELLIVYLGEGELEYAFRHPLAQEVAYAAQLSGRRREVHHLAASAIERLHPERLDQLAALVARHFEAGGDPLGAARYYARAAVWVGLSDLSQALAHWRKASEAIDALPDARGAGERVESSPGSVLATGLALMAHMRQLDLGWRLGISEQEAEAHYLAGKDLALGAADRVGLLGITDIYASVRALAGHREHALELAEEGDRLSIEIGNPSLRIAAALVTMHARGINGRPREALALADEMIELAGEDHALGSELGVGCPYAFCLNLRGSFLSHVGRLEEAAEAIDRALLVAREQGDLENEGFAHGNRVVLARYTGEVETALRDSAKCHEIAERTGSALSRAMALGYVGHARLMAGQVHAAMEVLERAIELTRAAHTARESEPFWLVGISEAMIASGDYGRAVDAAREAVALALEVGTRLVIPTCHRALAEALLARGEPQAAHESLDAALAAVEETGVRSELPFIERARARLGVARA